MRRPGFGRRLQHLVVWGGSTWAWTSLILIDNRASYEYDFAHLSGQSGFRVGFGLAGWFGSEATARAGT